MLSYSRFTFFDRTVVNNKRYKSTNNQLSYSIRNKYFVEEFEIRLSYESWDSIFSNNDNMNVDSSFNIFLNNYLRTVYTNFPLIKII
jgi:competence transcription factor ComK